MFTKLEDNIDDIQASEVVGPIELFTGNLIHITHYNATEVDLFV